MTAATEEYLRRNLVVCKAVGAHAGAKHALAILRKRKRIPKWLIKSLEGIEGRTAPLARELAAYRDSVTSGEKL